MIKKVAASDMVFAGMQEIQKNKEFQNLFKFASKKDDDKDEKKVKKDDGKKGKNPFAKKDKKENPFAKKKDGKKGRNPFAKKENPFAKKETCEDNKKSDKDKKNAYLVRSLSKVSQVLNESGYLKSSLYAIKALETLVAKAQDEEDDYYYYNDPLSESVEYEEDEEDEPRHNKTVNFEMEKDFGDLDYDMESLMDSDVGDVFKALTASERANSRKEQEKIFFQMLEDYIANKDDNAASDFEIDSGVENFKLKDVVNSDLSFDDLMDALEAVSHRDLSKKELERAFIQELGANRDYSERDEEYSNDEYDEYSDEDSDDEDAIKSLLDEVSDY
jgi:hypothetical protein